MVFTWLCVRDSAARSMAKSQIYGGAPGDNIGEIATPVMVLVVIGLEGLFDALPIIERVPYLADDASEGEGIWGAHGGCSDTKAKPRL